MPPPTPNPPDAFSFAVLGDAPYYKHEEWRQRLVWNDIEAHDLAAVIHIGDIFWRPCSDAMYAKTRQRFDTVRHPLIYTPGDNEWVDCWEPRVGGYKPLDRLAQIRRAFFSDPSRSMGRRRIELTSQRGYPENARWRTNGVVFATVHLLGSRNGYITYREVTQPGYLRRVIVTTASPARMSCDFLHRICRVLAKPFDIDELVLIARQCATHDAA